MPTHLPPVLASTLAGLAATAPMTLAMSAMHRRLEPKDQYPLPPRLITENLLEEVSPDQNLSESAQEAATWVSHFAYGAVVGAMYAPVAQKIPLHPVVKGVAFGLAVWSVSYLGWLPAVGLLPSATRQPAPRNALMITAHVVWGAAAGLLTHALTPRRPRAACTPVGNPPAGARPSNEQSPLDHRQLLADRHRVRHRDASF